MKKKDAKAVLKWLEEREDQFGREFYKEETERLRAVIADKDGPVVELSDNTRAKLSAYIVALKGYTLIADRTAEEKIVLKAKKEYDVAYADLVDYLVKLEKKAQGGTK